MRAHLDAYSTLFAILALAGGIALLLVTANSIR